MSRPRILFCADADSVHTRRWVAAMAARGFNCVVLTRATPSSTGPSLAGASEVISIRPGDSMWGWFLALAEVRHHARRLAPQWVHGHYVTGYGLWAAASGLGPEVPVVLTAWGSDLLVTPREAGWRGAALSALLGWSLARAALITADSQELLAVARRYAGAGPRLEEINWGADVERFRPGKPAAAASTSARFDVVSLRRWSANYRIDAILRAFATLRSGRPRTEARLHLLGGGPDEAALRALATELGLRDAVVWIGQTDEVGMLASLQSCQVSISVPRSDGSSVAMLESMACGLPVIASDLPANRQWIDAASGLLVAEADGEHAFIEALAAALLALHDDPARAQREGARNRERVVQRASRRTQMDRMAALYTSLRLKAPRPAEASAPR